MPASFPGQTARETRPRRRCVCYHVLSKRNRHYFGSDQTANRAVTEGNGQVESRLKSKIRCFAEQHFAATEEAA